MIGIEHFIVVSAILFVLGVLGIFLNRKNIIVILMAIELILLAVNINLVAFSAFLGDLTGQVFAMFVLTVAAGEAAIGLAILVIYFRSRGTIAVQDANRRIGQVPRPPGCWVPGPHRPGLGQANQRLVDMSTARLGSRAGSGIRFFNPSYHGL